MKIIKKGNKHKAPKWTCIQECERCGSILEVGLKDIHGYWYSGYVRRFVCTRNRYYCPVCKTHNYLNPIVSEQLMNHLNQYYKE